MIIMPITNIKKIQGKLTEFWLDENGVFHICALDKLITLDLIEVDYKNIVNYLEGHEIKPPVLYDATHSPPLDRACRQRLDVLLDEVFSSLAVVSDSRIGGMVANIFFALARATVPKKIFLNKQEAYEWLVANFDFYNS
jgi:hypothetical protein